MRVRIAAARALVYLPHHLGIAHGHFADAGVDVEVVEHEAGRSDITSLLLDGRAELVLGSLVYAHALALRTPAAIVAVSNRQTRHFLFARGADPGFAWSDLRGRTVVVEPTAVPTSWVGFVAALHRAGLTLEDVRTLVGYSPASVLDEFAGGAGDYLLAGVGAALRPELAIAAPLADALGPAPWSVYCATRAWARREPAALSGFLAGLRGALRWIDAAEHADVSAVARDLFPDEDPALVDVAVARYRRIGFWATDPAPDRDDLVRWEAALVDGGLLPPTSRLSDMVGVAA